VVLAPKGRNSLAHGKALGLMVFTEVLTMQVVSFPKRNSDQLHRNAVNFSKRWDKKGIKTGMKLL